MFTCENWNSSHILGFGGSNAAVLLEEAPFIEKRMHKYTNGHSNGNGYISGNGDITGNGHHETNGTSSGASSPASSVIESPGRKRLFVVSAKSEPSILAYLSLLTDYLGTISHSGEFTKNLSYTLGQRRTHHAYRVGVVSDSLTDLKTQVATIRVSKSKSRVLAFAFTGQGAQYVVTLI
jgi:acyl transferase domain-containing protein